MREFNLLLAAVLSFLAVANNSNAATIEKATSANCVMLIRGDIAEGDFDKFVALGKSLLPGDNGESTSGDTVCLDSSGGNFSESVKFARYFYSGGIGTVIDDGQRCYAACAVMFMMGTAKGAEMGFANRKLHVGGKLGFQRPRFPLSLEKPNDIAATQTAYDGALSAIVDLIAVANSRAPWSNQPMMKPDLVQQMLEQAGNTMFMIDTVDKTGRWDIEVIGAPEPSLLSEEQAFYACENSLGWQIGLTEHDITYSKVSAGMGGGRLVQPLSDTAAEAAYQVEGLASGDAVEGCVVSKRQNAVLGCGIDENSDTRLGQGVCDRSDFVDRSSALKTIAIYNPATKLADLRAGKVSVAAPSRDARCLVIKDAQIVDDERCAVISVDDAETKQGAKITHFVWPSGGKTVLVQSGSSLEINGAPTTKRTVAGRGDCYMNSATLNDFCVLLSPN